MSTIEIGSILVATDLGEPSDRLVRVASSIAALTGAELHIVHVQVVRGTPDSDPAAASSLVADAESRLDHQVRRAVPSHFTPASQMVLARPSPSEAIRRHAETLSADLLVIGPHRGVADERGFLGTTADRLLSTSGVPCLIVRDGPDFPITRLGVLVDFSPAATAALEAAAVWASAFAGGGDGGEKPAATIDVAHIVWAPEGQRSTDEVAARALPEVERAIERTRRRLDGAPGVEFVPRVLTAGDANAVVGEWVRQQSLSMLILGTRGSSRLPYTYIGGLASALARSAPASVLLVPPDYVAEGRDEERNDRIRLRRVVTGVDFHEPSWEAALWAMRYFAPDAEHELIHVLDLPDLPAPLRAFSRKLEETRLTARSSARKRLEELRDLGSCPNVGLHVEGGRPAPEILRLAGEVEADVIVVGEQGPTHGMGALLGSTAERVLADSQVPVLVARKVLDSAPRTLLVAIDSSEAAGPVLDWTAALLDRFDARATLINVVDRLLLTDELAGMPDAGALRSLESDAARAMREWLDERIRESGLPGDRVETMIGIGDPSYEIIAQARRAGADLVVLGSRGGSVARTALIGRIVNKVVRSAPTSVLVVGSAKVR